MQNPASSVARICAMDRQPTYPSRFMSELRSGNWFKLWKMGQTKVQFKGSFGVSFSGFVIEVVFNFILCFFFFFFEISGR
ncbi:hypothetical protein NC652_019514 [Populus alba x Populus x berolinensis]|nr:hypothetical protein NC652_019514 [Populus alba x Populus x berolinensis]